MKNSRTRRANREVDGLRDVPDENRLLLVVLEEVQRARRHIEVDLQHHRRSFEGCVVSKRCYISMNDTSIVAATKSGGMRREGGEGEDTGS
jgi:hypothetical protein